MRHRKTRSDQWRCNEGRAGLGAQDEAMHVVVLRDVTPMAETKQSTCIRVAGGLFEDLGYPNAHGRPVLVRHPGQNSECRRWLGYNKRAQLLDTNAARAERS